MDITNHTKKRPTFYSIIGPILLLGFMIFNVPFQLEDAGVASAIAGQVRDQSPVMGPAPEDGKGKAFVTPNGDVVCGEQGTWTIIYTVAKTGIAVGGGIAVHVSPFWGWTAPQDYNPAMPGYVSVSCSNTGASLDILTGGRGNYIVVRTTDSRLLPGDVIKVIYGDTQGGKYPDARARADRYSEKGERFFIKVDGNGDGHFFAIGKHPTINILPRPAERLVVTAPSLVAADTSFTIQVAAVDVVENWVRSYDEKVALTSEPPGAVFQGKAVKDGAVSFACTLHKEGIYRFIAKGGRSGISGVSNTVLCSSRKPRSNLFWADLHGHSQLSDGTGTPEDYFLYGRFVAGLDAVALTDHDAFGFDALDEHEEIWSFIKATANRMNTPGAFITLLGYEWTSWTYGHKHVLFFDDGASLYSSRMATSDTPEKLWQSLKGWRAITISHHVGGGPIAANWDYHDPHMEPVVEVCSIHGNSEYMGCPNCIYHPQKGSFVRDALAKGYKMGIISGGDTHNGHPGMGDPLSPVGGLMAFYAESLNREELWDALKHRRVYGTSGDRIILDFRINGHLMGETIPEGDNTSREIHIYAVGTEGFKEIEVVKNNRTLARWEQKGQSFNHVLRDKPALDHDFYYLRVVQNNGQMAWSSPIWFHP